MMITNASADASEDLRERLLEMRNSLIAGLAASRILLRSVGAAIAALDGIRPGDGSSSEV